MSYFSDVSSPPDKSSGPRTNEQDIGQESGKSGKVFKWSEQGRLFAEFVRKGGGTILLKAENDIIQTIFFMVFEIGGEAEGVIDRWMTFSEFGFETGVNEFSFWVFDTRFVKIRGLRNDPEVFILEKDFQYKMFFLFLFSDGSL